MRDAGLRGAGAARPRVRGLRGASALAGRPALALPLPPGSLRAAPLLTVPLLAVLLFVTGCAAGPDPDASPTASTPAPTGTAYPGFIDDEPTTTPTLPTSEAEALEDARVRGADALALYLRPAVDAETWLVELTPYLATEAYELAAATDPATLPAVEVFTDRAAIVEGATSVTAIVLVPTSAGDWHVSMRRDAAGGPWLVSAFLPPADARSAASGCPSDAVVAEVPGGAGEPRRRAAVSDAAE